MLRKHSRYNRKLP